MNNAIEGNVKCAFCAHLQAPNHVRNPGKNEGHYFCKRQGMRARPIPSLFPPATASKILGIIVSITVTDANGINFSCNYLPK